MTERPNKPESSGLNELRTFEYTSRQLIFAICVFLLLGAGLILLGIQLGQREKYSKINEQIAAQSKGQTTEKDQKENSGQDIANQGKGTQLSPIAAPVSPTKSTISKNETRDAEQPRFVEVPAPVPSGSPAGAKGTENTSTTSDTSTGQSVSPQTISQSLVSGIAQAQPAEPQPGTTAVNQSPSNSPSETITPESTRVPTSEKTETKPLEPMSDIADDRPEDTHQETLQPPTSVTKPGEKGGYAIQVAAIPSSRKREAEEYLKKLKDLNPYIMESDDKKFLRILVGEFPDKQSAENKMLELKQKKEFSGCFIRKI